MRHWGREPPPPPPPPSPPSPLPGPGRTLRNRCPPPSPSPHPWEPLHLQPRPTPSGPTAHSRPLLLGSAHLGANLVAALARLDVYDLAHGAGWRAGGNAVPRNCERGRRASSGRKRAITTPQFLLLYQRTRLPCIDVTAGGAAGGRCARDCGTTRGSQGAVRGEGVLRLVTTPARSAE